MCHASADVGFQISAFKGLHSKVSIGIHRKTGEHIGMHGDTASLDQATPGPSLSPWQKIALAGNSAHGAVVFVQLLRPGVVSARLGVPCSTISVE